MAHVLKKAIQRDSFQGANIESNFQRLTGFLVPTSSDFSLLHTRAARDRKFLDAALFEFVKSNPSPQAIAY